MRGEEWRPVVGFEGSYEVSNLGRVRSLDRLDARGNQIRGRVLRLAAQRSGHLHLGLWADGKERRTFVHRLVLAAFVGPRPVGAEALHGNGRPDDNRVENLRWGTPSENQLDSVAHGTHRSARKTHCKSGHAFSAENTYIHRGRRQCRACHREGDQIAARLRGATRG